MKAAVKKTCRNYRGKITAKVKYFLQCVHIFSGIDLNLLILMTRSEVLYFYITESI